MSCGVNSVLQTWLTLHIVRWLHENRNEGCTENALDDAAEEGHLDVVRWLGAHRTETTSVKKIKKIAVNGTLLKKKTVQKTVLV